LNFQRENGEKENRIGCEILCTFGNQRGKDSGRMDLDRYYVSAVVYFVHCSGGVKGRMGDMGRKVKSLLFCYLR
jgi:hypothetical protein